MIRGTTEGEAASAGETGVADHGRKVIVKTTADLTETTQPPVSRSSPVGLALMLFLLRNERSECVEVTSLPTATQVVGGGPQTRASGSGAWLSTTDSLEECVFT